MFLTRKEKCVISILKKLPTVQGRYKSIFALYEVSELEPSVLDAIIGSLMRKDFIHFQDRQKTMIALHSEALWYNEYVRTTILSYLVSGILTPIVVSTLTTLLINWLL